MTTEQYVKIHALSLCTFLPASYDKRFVRDMTCLPFDHELSDKQSVFLDKLYYRYRKQISAKYTGAGSVIGSAMRAVNLVKLPEFVKPETTEETDKSATWMGEKESDFDGYLQRKYYGLPKGEQ